MNLFRIRADGHGQERLTLMSSYPFGPRTVSRAGDGSLERLAFDFIADPYRWRVELTPAEAQALRAWLDECLATKGES